MALVSPGLQLTVTDESQYISNAVGTTPLVIMATAEDKTINGALATGTTAANAGKLQIFGSQRELSTAMGYPTFQQSSAGTPLHGDERNEYGLMAAYSALGVNNQLYAIRADINLDELAGTSVRPTAPVADGTYWFDVADSTFGIYEWDAELQEFIEQTPIIVNDSANTVSTTQGALNGIPAPIQSLGAMGSYAVVTSEISNRIFHKVGDKIGSIDPNSTKNTWVLVGTPKWHASHPTVVGTESNPTLTNTSNLKINSTTVTLGGTTVLAFAANINTAAITGVTADVVDGQLYLYSDSTSTGATAGDGKIKIETAYSGASNTALISALGLTSATYAAPEVAYGDYANVPYWTEHDSTPRPDGSVWFKAGATGGGANFVIKRYNATTDSWTTQAANFYYTETAAIYGLDPIGGGLNIPVGTLYIREDLSGTSASLTYGSYRIKVRTVAGAVSAVGTTTSGTPFTNLATFRLITTAPGTAVATTYTLTIRGTGLTDFVNAVNAGNIPYVVASIDSATDGIKLTHEAGGDITISQIAGQPDFAALAGFTPGATNVYGISTAVTIGAWDNLTYIPEFTTPVADPANGTYWYFSDPTVVDIMVNTGSAWKGYLNGGTDLRGYTLANTDPMGVIVSASRPTTQSDNTPLVPGDIWLDTSDLENWPKLSRHNGVSFVQIDNTDQVGQNGILFADARWDTDGTTDPAADNETSIADLLSSDYTDLDCPNPALYPRGMLLFNTRRSGYNVKKYVQDYYSIESSAVSVWSSITTYGLGAKIYYGSTIYVSLQASNAGENPTSESDWWAELITNAWVSSSGLKSDGSPYAGHHAQRQIIVAAMQSALSSSTEIREEQFKFSIICAPGYPELIDEMVSLNNDRANTAFIIGDTPMRLSTNPVNIINWSNNSDGTGLSTADPYLAVYYPSGLSSDLGGNTIMVPPSHMALRTYLYNDNVAYPWFAPAGTRRGLVSNATDLGYLNTTTGEFNRSGINNALRDTLYANKINPITIIPGIGLVVWGQKTRDPNTESMDRVNVSRLVNYIRTIFASAGNAFLFEPNDKITRDQFAAILNRALNDLVAKRGIYDYLVVCDTTNNTPDRIANNQLYADVAIEPMKDVEFIYIPIRLYNPGDIATLGSK